MHIFMDNFHHSGKYYDQLANHQAELRREGKFTDQKYLSISFLQTYHINIYSRSGCGKNSERENLLQKKCTFGEGANHSADFFFESNRKEHEKSHAAGDSDNRNRECKPHKCFRCGSEDHLIVKFPNPPKYN